MGTSAIAKTPVTARVPVCRPTITPNFLNKRKGCYIISTINEFNVYYARVQYLGSLRRATNRNKFREITTSMEGVVDSVPIFSRRSGPGIPKVMADRVL